MRNLNYVILIMFLIGFSISSNLKAQTTYTVCAGGCDFTTIQAAIDDAGTVNGDIISILDAVHTESGINVTKNLTIQGLGTGSTIVQAHADQGSATDRVFNDTAGSNNVTFSDMTVMHGNVTGRGGGIYSYDDEVTISDCIIRDNDVTADGGGVYIDYYGSGSITNSTISSNNSGGVGGGLYNYGAIASITNSTFNNNTSSNEGGGIYNHYYGTISSMTISTIGNNEVTAANGNGGGLYNHGTITSLLNCTISGNICEIYGGGIYNIGTITLGSVTIANNECGSDGGGLRMADGSLIIKNTIIGNNSHTDPVLTADDYYYTAGTLTDNGNNLVEITNVGAGSGGFTNSTNNDIVGEQANLNLSSTLADNSTLNDTYTLALSIGSAAIDTGTDSGAPSTDQRGFSRFSTTDIGAYEYQSPPNPVVLSIFTAAFANGSSFLEWTTQSESNNLGWNIYRSPTDLENALQINGNLIEGAGTSTEPTEYEFLDEQELVVNTTYNYWIESISYTGHPEYHGPISLTIPEQEDDDPDEQDNEMYGLFHNYPNPVSNYTTIAYNLPETVSCTLSIYNTRGQMIRELSKTYSKSGSFVWDGTNDKGNEVSSGLYYYKMKAGRYTGTKKMILMK